MGNEESVMLPLVYGKAADKARERLKKIESWYHELYGEADVEFYSAPGRTEIIGNHTDHNGGKILAASITMDTVGCAARREDGQVHIMSEGYDDEVVIDLATVNDTPHCQGTLSLVAGMLVAAREMGYEIGGFNATVSSEVIPSAGVSSSASFEMLVCCIIDHLFNGDSIPCADYARIGQYAENHFWDKASGLMDQMACAVGGTILLDFSKGVSYRKVDFSYDALGFDLVIVNTGKGHADLSAEYSAVPGEMRAVAAALGVKNLCETNEAALLDNLNAVREQVGNDRAILRALHYFEECGRVNRAVRALEAGDKAKVLDMIEASGNSSWKWLQNAYVASDPSEQSIPLALALTEIFLHRVGSGVCRLHGGGFAGVIMCAVPKDKTDEYVAYMASYFGADNVYRTGIRQTGAVCLGSL
ncbi:galactokinase family protein [Collinsella sp. An2]|uniref:galactokinase n=1 Tax=Collinsella sp. An2 TaxID=1965585 RepID=UPI000B385D54|nr:galactokinase family protein [Collinsella sp. An2]OUP10481.1 galactokinase [Collinsella sp. An2]